jgi:DNA-binding NarL/FixJ family response regulator
MLVVMEIEGLFRRQGCEIVGPAQTVRRALALLDQERPDPALLHLNLNGQSARPIAAELSEQEIPFVVVTGYDHPQARDPNLRGAPRVGKSLTLLRVLTRRLEAAFSA